MPVKVTESSAVIHYMYVKAHSVKYSSSSKPLGRTLLVLSVPPFCSRVYMFSNYTAIIDLIASLNKNKN